MGLSTDKNKYKVYTFIGQRSPFKTQPVTTIPTKIPESYKMYLKKVVGFELRTHIYI